MTDESDIPEPEQPRGLYSGFERYTTPATEAYRTVMNEGLVILDTSTLLNLYRYTPRARAALFNILAKIGDQLWEPEQVMREFWRNREPAVRDYGAAARDFNRSVTAAMSGTIEAIRTLSNRVGLDEGHKHALVQQMEAAFADLSASVEKTMTEGGAAEPSRDTGADPVLASLEPLLNGRVGGPLDPESQEIAHAEAMRRIAAKEPPGYKDASKSADYAVGDFLIWTQLLAEAVSRGCDVLLITGDVKEDWWRRWGGVPSGPRFELLDEFHARVGRRLFMLQPADFLEKAAAIFGVEAVAEDVAQAREIERVDGSEVASVGALAVHYVREVADALARVTGETVVTADQLPELRFSSMDAELESAGQRIALIVRFSTHSPLGWDWISKGLAAAEEAQYDRALVVANQPIHADSYGRLGELSVAARFAQWNDVQDDQSLRRVVRDLLTPRDGA